MMTPVQTSVSDLIREYQPSCAVGSAAWASTTLCWAFLQVSRSSTFFGWTMACTDARVHQLVQRAHGRNAHYLSDGGVRQRLREQLGTRIARHVVRDGFFSHDLADLFEIVAEVGGPLREEVFRCNRLIIYAAYVSQRSSEGERTHG